MPKTAEEWRELDRWSPDKSLARIGEISAEITKVALSDICFTTADELVDLADEAIVLMLHALKQVIEEKRWVGVRPLDIFEGAYGDLSGATWEVVVGRFIDTKSVVEAYRKGAGKEKRELKNKLIERGFI